MADLYLFKINKKSSVPKLEKSLIKNLKIIMFLEKVKLNTGKKTTKNRFSYLEAKSVYTKQMKECFKLNPKL